MTTIEHTYSTEAEARTDRRALINAGFTVSLLSYDGSRDLYAFDTIS